LFIRALCYDKLQQTGGAAVYQNFLAADQNRNPTRYGGAAAHHRSEKRSRKR
jgi:hypothetical protein